MFPGWPAYSTRYWMGRQYKEAESFGDGVRMRKDYFIHRGTNATRRISHRESNAASGNPSRLALERLILKQPYITVLCLVLMPDFICFGYQMPEACHNVSTDGLSCPLPLLPRAQQKRLTGSVSTRRLL